MEDLCRICRKHCPFSSIQIKSSHNGISVSEMLSKTVPIDLTLDDPLSQLLPQYICTDCIEIISAAFNLQQVCIESDNYFRSTIKTEQVIVKDEILEDQVAVKEELMDYEEEMISYGTFYDENEESGQDDEEGGDDEDERRRKRVKRKNEKPMFNPRPVNKDETSDDAYFACNFCELQQRPKWTLLRHMHGKHNPKLLPFYCRFCYFRFKEKAKQEQHETTHRLNDKPILICEICTATGNTEIGMLHHKIDDHNIPHAGSEVKIEQEVDSLSKKYVPFNPRPVPGSEIEDGDRIWYACNFCDKKIRPKYRILRHMERHSAVLYPLGCEYCIKRFRDKATFDEHVKLYHARGEKTTIFCKICGASGSSQEGMDNHIKDDHEGAKRVDEPIMKGRYNTFRCTLCDARFPRKQRLDNHMLKKHNEAK